MRHVDPPLIAMFITDARLKTHVEVMRKRHTHPNTNISCFLSIGILHHTPSSIPNGTVSFAFPPLVSRFLPSLPSFYPASYPRTNEIVSYITYSLETVIVRIHNRMVFRYYFTYASPLSRLGIRSIHGRNYFTDCPIQCQHQ